MSGLALLLLGLGSPGIRVGCHRGRRAALQSSVSVGNTVLFLLLLALPARAGEFVAYDLPCSRILSEQGRLLLEAGDVLEDWAAGRLDTAVARQRLDASLARCRELVRELQALAPPRAAAGLGSAARRAGRVRQELLEEARHLLERTPTRARLLRFQEGVAERTAQALEPWLRARLEAIRGAGRGSPYYTWQEQLLPLQVQQLQLGRAAQGLLSRLSSGSGEGEVSPTPRLVDRCRELRKALDRVEPDPAVRAAHEAVVAEFASLCRFCTAVELLAADPSPEAVSRVRRFARELRRRSRQAEERALDALVVELRQSQGGEPKFSR